MCNTSSPRMIALPGQVFRAMWNHAESRYDAFDEGGERLGYLTDEAGEPLELMSWPLPDGQVVYIQHVERRDED